jgi:uncharacterized membrane protein YdbT with pleckstrin-like domain
MFDWLRPLIAGPDIERHLLIDEGEVVIDEVHRHWAAYWRAFLETIGGVFFFVVFVFSDVDVAWVPFLISCVLFLHGSWLAVRENMDRFVITNMRVFRIRGVLSRKLATVPIIRILDITVKEPVIGRMLGYGHFVFESAAQEQGLRVIRYVGDPDERDLTIQRVIQRSGLRRSFF